MVAQEWVEDVERYDNDIIVLQKWRKALEFVYTFEQMEVAMEDDIQTRKF